MASAFLAVGGTTVAEYVTEPAVDPLRGPRPYLHPVRTLGGVVVTAVQPEDHPHHLGVSVAMPDTDGVNFWGGRTYVRDTGYVWRDNHGRIEHVGWLDQASDRFSARLRWRAPHGATLVEEERDVAALPFEDAWVLDVAYRLAAPGPGPVTLGSPATNGRPGNAGYGGFFWRAATGRPRVFDAASAIEAEVNGSTGKWVAMVGEAYTLVFTGLGDGDHWFVRAEEYPGVCVALAFERVRRIEPGSPLARRHRVIVADGARSRSEVHRLVRALPEPGLASG